MNTVLFLAGTGVFLAVALLTVHAYFSAWRMGREGWAIAIRLIPGAGLLWYFGDRSLSRDTTPFAPWPKAARITATAAVVIWSAFAAALIALNLWKILSGS